MEKFVKLPTGEGWKEAMAKSSIIALDSRVRLQPWPDFPESEISSGARGSNGCYLVDDIAAGLRIGRWEAEANLGRWVNWPVHEFMVVLAGEVVMVEHDVETVISAGECFFIPKGRRCIWNQSGYAKKIMVLFDDAPGMVADGSWPIQKINPAQNLSVALAPAGAALDSAAPDQESEILFRDPSGRMKIGVWQSTAFARKTIAAPRTEVMHILEGDLTLTDDFGKSYKLGRGDSLLVPLGAPNACKSNGLVRKVFCTIDPYSQDSLPQGLPYS